MNKILVLGAGLIAKPLVRYLLNANFYVNVASRTVSKAEKLIEGHPHGSAEPFNIADSAKLEELVSNSDIVISLLPYVHHCTVARQCIKHRKHLITTSYVSKEMQALNGSAKSADITILNEIGLDPGIDHMSAMKIIDDVRERGGEITSFYSYCGGLPAPEANTNPFGYKFSWSPRGVVLAAKNSAKYLENGKEIFIPSEKLFESYSIIDIEGLGKFEAYPNRDSLIYIEKYGIRNTNTMYRGTLRNIGWCPTWKKIYDLGLLDENVRTDIQNITFKKFISTLIGTPGKDIKSEIAEYLKIKPDSDIIKRFEWLGILSDDTLPLKEGSPLDILVAKLLEKLQYTEGERDMIILKHIITGEYPDGKKEKIESTLIEYGIPNGDTAMARTVGLPAAIAAKLICDGKIGIRGVVIPVIKAIYEPVLHSLEQEGIKCTEKVEQI